MGYRSRAPVVLVGAMRPAFVDRHFGGCIVVATVDNGLGVDNEEQGAPVRVCQQVRHPWTQMWPELRHLG